MQRPWYSFLFIKSPITKILIGIAALVLTLGLLAFQWRIEEPRMLAQTASWEGRTIEQGAALFANNCANCHGIDGKGLPAVAPALHSRYFFTQRLDDIGFTGSLADYVESTVAAGRPSKTISQWANLMPTWGSEYGGPLRPDQVIAVSAFVLNWEESALQQTPEEDPWQPFQDAVTTAITGTVAAAPAASGDGPRAPEDLWTVMGCMGCHNFQENQSASNRGPIAPHFGNLDERAGDTVPGMDALTYIHDSIVNPNAHLADGYPGGVMPQNFTDRMSEEEIMALSQWVLDQAAAN